MHKLGMYGNKNKIINKDKGPFVKNERKIPLG